MPKYWGSDGNEIGFAEALNFQDRSPKEYAAAQRAAKVAKKLPDGVGLIATFHGIGLLDNGQISSAQGGGTINGANARVEVSGTRDIAARRTMMRTVTPLAFLGQKKRESDTRKCFLVIEGRGWATTVAVPLNSEEQARSFAARVNAAAAALTTPVGSTDSDDSVPTARAAGHPRPMPSKASDLATQLSRLGEMWQSGILSEEEFTTAKARLLETP